MSGLETYNLCSKIDVAELRKGLIRELYFPKKRPQTNSQVSGLGSGIDLIVELREHGLHLRVQPFALINSWLINDPALG